MHSDRLFFDSNLTDRSSDRFAKPADVAEPPLLFSPGNFFADFLDRTVIYY
jgi:hypothetical protein